MSKSFNMTGGSAGSANMGRRGPRTGFFQSGVRHAFASGDREIRGRILPAFDTSLSTEDKAYSRSWVPYRDMAADPSEYDQETQTPPFTSWFQVFKGYRFFGKSGDSFISPLTLRGYVPENESKCPVFECFMKAKKSDNPAWLALLKSDKKDDRGVLPAPSVLVALNMYMPLDKDNWENAVYTMPLASLIDLKAKLSVLTPRAMPEPYDPDFPDFLFGDVTHPHRGLVVTGTKITLSTNAAIKFNGFRIGTSDNTLKGVASKTVSEDVLARRWELGSDKTLKILSAQDIVNLLLDDGCIPFDLVAEACSDFADVRPSRTKGTTVETKQRGEVSREQTYAAPEVTDSEVYWGVVGGKTAKVTTEQVQEMVDDGQDPAKIKLMRLDKTGGWQNAAAFGFSQPAVEEDEAPPPPDEDEAPPPPEEDEAPPPPDEDEAPPAPADEVSATKGGLTQAEADELKGLKESIMKGSKLEGEQLSRLVKLNLKAGG